VTIYVGAEKGLQMITVMALIQTAIEITEKTVENNFDAMQIAASGDVKGAVFNRVIKCGRHAYNYAQTDIELDVISQFFFPDISSSMTAASSSAFNLAMGLPGPLIADLNAILCLQNTVVAPPMNEGGIKWMSILRKRPDISSEDFQDHWFNLHSSLAKRLVHISGCRQNLVLDGPRDAKGHMMVDGVLELWFPDNDSFETAFQTAAGKTLMIHANEFAAEISTFMTSPVEIIGKS
jgi:uncharacterized protein (TIGR02118 family)